MAAHYLDHLAAESVAKARQRFYGAQSPSPGSQGQDLLGDDELGFIARRDSFYLATLSESGWPYMQHRGGPAGFLRPISAQQLAFADLRGNKQLLSTGNVLSNPRVSLFLMDYVRRERLKILGLARVFGLEERPELLETATPLEWRARVERFFVVDVQSFDWNCPKFITPRYSLPEVEEATAPLRARIAELERQLALSR